MVGSFPGGALSVLEKWQERIAMEDQFAYLNASAHSVEVRRRTEESSRLPELGFSLIGESIAVTTPLGTVEALPSGRYNQ